MVLHHTFFLIQQSCCSEVVLRLRRISTKNLCHGLNYLCEFDLILLIICLDSYTDHNVWDRKLNCSYLLSEFQLLFIIIIIITFHLKLACSSHSSWNLLFPNINFNSSAFNILVDVNGYFLKFWLSKCWYILFDCHYESQDFSILFPS